jgi:subtilisin family serine protease
MALRIFDWMGYGTAADAIRAIDYSTYNGAHISNNSYSFTYDQPGDGRAFEGAVERARANGKLLVASAGNDYINVDCSPRSPACCDLDNVIAVLATDHNDNKPSYSNFGPYSVDVGAPGGTDTTQGNYNVYSTKKDNAYQYHAGTSMASPHVAGLAALVKAHRPSLNWWQIKTVIMHGVDPKGSLSGKCVTQGRINAYGALTHPTPNTPAAPTNLNAQVFGDDIRLTWTDNSGNESGFDIYRKNGCIFVQFDYTDPNVTTYWDYDLPPGTYIYYVRAFNADGDSPKTLHKSAKVY